MQIDWLTVAAQITNFLVLVWLLQRFLYRPITNAMEKRETQIEKRLSDARSARAKAQDEAQEWRRKQQLLDDSTQDILSTAKGQADELRQRLTKDVREEAEGNRQAWQDKLGSEKQAFAKKLKKHANHQVVRITASVLRSYTNTELTHQLCSSFAMRLAELNSQTQSKLRLRGEQLTGPGFIESSRPLDEQARHQVLSAIHEFLGSTIELKFREDEDLILGIRLIIAEQIVEWSANQYLQSLEAELEKVIDSQQRYETSTPD